MPVADTSQLISGVAERYASSLFELALEAGSVDKVGSRQIDTSLRTKLSTLKLALKEVG